MTQQDALVLEGGRLVKVRPTQLTECRTGWVKALTKL